MASSVFSSCGPTNNRAVCDMRDPGASAGKGATMPTEYKLVSILRANSSRCCVSSNTQAEAK